MTLEMVFAVVLLALITSIKGRLFTLGNLASGLHVGSSIYSMG
jgi:hypothetical protein